MISLLTFAWCLSVDGAYAQLEIFDKNNKSCRELGHCRSIWDIIWSCFTTIFSCTWLALHPNVPKQGKGKLWKLMRRTAAFGSALIAPEIFIMHAWDQRAAAKELAAEHKEAYKWTLTHGFFANMGGFMVHDESGEDYIIDPDQIGIYLRNGQINTTEAEIQDKSKGDILTKGLVVLQTTWFILQLIARAVQHLPITELEIATLAFAVLNGITYALWWNKPLDVECPIILSSHADVWPRSDLGFIGRMRLLLFGQEKPPQENRGPQSLSTRQGQYMQRLHFGCHRSVVWRNPLHRMGLPFPNLLGEVAVADHIHFCVYCTNCAWTQHNRGHRRG